jgi:acetylornithine deacetylase/succinyl-diaminopimelate desuccinylase-like protein
MKDLKKGWIPKRFPVDCEEIKESCNFLSELIKINTTNPPGNETLAAQYCKSILEKEGFENIELIESAPNRGNLIYRWKGTDPTAKKLLLLAHLDVVPANPLNWEKDPFCGTIEGEYVWGRGALDCKGLVVAEAMACIFLKREGFKPRGDIILAFTAGEETGGEMGVGFLTKNHWEKINVDYVINEGGGFLMPFGKVPSDYVVQIGEKGVFRTIIRVKGRGGHGSMLVKKSENAVYKISKITQKIIEYKYPIEINRSYKETIQKLNFPRIVKKILTSKHLVRPVLKLADKFTGENLSNIILPLIMDVLNPTVLKGSEKINVVPQYAEMSFDCRLLPSHDRTTIEKNLKRALGKKLFNEIEIIQTEENRLATINTMYDPFWEHIEKITNEMHGGANLVPFLSQGSTDSKYFREKGKYALGFSPMRKDPHMSLNEMLEMNHGKNERIWIPNLSYMMEFIYRLVRDF